MSASHGSATQTSRLSMQPVLPSRSLETLADGVQASLVEFGTVPKAAIVAVMRMGRIEEAENLWLTKLVCDLLKQGTLAHSADEVADRILSMGGQLDFRTTDDELVVTLDVLAEFAPAAAELLGEILQQPRMTELGFVRAQANCLRELDVLRSYPGAGANAALLSELYPRHPYGVSLPTPVLLKEHDLDRVRRFYVHNLGASRTSVYVVGRFQSREVRQMLQRSFGAWASGPELRQLHAPHGAAAARLIDFPDSQQSSIRVGRRTVPPRHADYPAVAAANAILGGSLTSRITRNLREEKGWTYSPIGQVATVSNAAAWIEYVDVRPEVTGSALTEIFREIDVLRTAAPSDSELEEAKNFLYGQFLMMGAGRRGVADNLAFVHLHGLPENWFTLFRDQLYALTPVDVQRAVCEYFDPAAMSLVVVGDLKTVAGQVERFMSARGMKQVLRLVDEECE